MTPTGAVAVVTGAASGIGRATALALAARGAHLALTDLDEPGLATTAADARAWGGRVTTHVMDVTDDEAVRALPDAVVAAHGRVSLLVSNAGVTLVGSVAEVTLDEVRRVLDVNLVATIGHTLAFLPVLRREPAAHVVVVSSLFGLVAPAGQAAYAASKFGVRGFAEALRHETADGPVGVTVVHPGGIRTAIARNARVAAGTDPRLAAAETARFDRVLARTPPEVVAGAIVRAVERGRGRVVVGAGARTGDLLARLSPGGYWAVMGRVLGRGASAGGRPGERPTGPSTRPTAR